MLLIESHPGAAGTAAGDLEVAGHHVHRCHDPADPAFPCRGVADPSGCPLDGPIDLVLAMRSADDPRPTAREAGVSCALRAGVPVIEGGAVEDGPFDDWLTARVGDAPVAAACEDAVERSYEPLLHDVRRRCSPLFDAAGIDPARVSFGATLEWPKLQVHLDIAQRVSRGVREALAVRTLDAVRASRRSYGTVNVHVRDAAHSTDELQWSE